jgi:hypothetical protein
MTISRLAGESVAPFIEGALMPSAYYAESIVHCSLEHSWKVLLNYQAWNPSFAGAKVIRVQGEPNREGEIVRIQKAITDSSGKTWPEFYAQTVKIVPYHHVVWHVYSQSGDPSRNFVDFTLEPATSAVKLRIGYYALNPLWGEALDTQRREMDAALRDLAVAFKNYCETGS